MHFGYQHLTLAYAIMIHDRLPAAYGWPNWKEGTEFRAVRDAQR